MSIAALEAHRHGRGRHRRFLEGMDLTPTEMTDTNEAAEQQPEVANTHDHEHEHDQNHEHTHQHAPSLNPELTREIEVEVGADEVSKSFKTVVKRYQKLARI